MDIFKYWGKAQDGFHLLPFHSLDVAACAVTLLEGRPQVLQKLTALTGLGEANLRACVASAAALHDLGKLSPSFQQKVPEVCSALGQSNYVCPDDVRHDSLGWALWHDDTKRAHSFSSAESDAAAIWIQSATGHHGSPPSRSGSNGLPVRLSRYFRDEDIQAARHWSLFVHELFNPRWGLGDREQLKRASWWVAGLINLADWLGSSTQWFPYFSTPKDLSQYWSDCRMRSKRAAHESGLVQAFRKRDFLSLFPKYEPTPLQSLVIELAPRTPFLLVIEEATGGGKTETAIAAAGGDAFYFGLPSMATANGLWSRVSALEGQQALVHAKRWMLPKAMGRATSWINDTTRKALLANIGVGTVDQAMLAVLLTRFNVLRLLGLAGRTLIIDEVHAYDPYMNQVLERLIEFHAYSGGNVVLLSATMPLKVRQSLSDAWCRGRGRKACKLGEEGFPLVTLVEESHHTQRLTDSYKSRTVDLEYEHSSSNCLSKIALIASQGNCVAWIRNTVAEAMQAYQDAQELGLDPILFHARFTAADRLEIEQSVIHLFGKTSTKGERSGKVLIATQVIEQSLDLDFDFLISDLAPVDLIIQRAGRLHRHERGDRGDPRMCIHSPIWTDSPEAQWVQGWSKGTAYVYPDHSRLWLTVKNLGNKISLPLQTRQLVESVYGPGATDHVPDGLRKNSEQTESSRVTMALKARQNVIRLGSQYSADDIVPWTDENAPTRLGERSVEWVVCSNGSPINGDVERSVISLRSSSILRAPACDGIDTGSWRRTIDLSTGQAECEGLNGQRLHVSYDAKRGLLIQRQVV